MSTSSTNYQFAIEPSAEVLREISELVESGYFIHKEWFNGVEMRKKGNIGVLGALVRFLCILLFPIVFVPYFARAVHDFLRGYKYRVLVTQKDGNPEIFFV